MGTEWLSGYESGPERKPGGDVVSGDCTASEVLNALKVFKVQKVSKSKSSWYWESDTWLRLSNSKSDPSS
jgi:hypothetical protein